MYSAHVSIWPLFEEEDEEEEEHIHNSQGFLPRRTNSKRNQIKEEEEEEEEEEVKIFFWENPNKKYITPLRISSYKTKYLCNQQRYLKSHFQKEIIECLVSSHTHSSSKFTDKQTDRQTEINH